MILTPLVNGRVDVAVLTHRRLAMAMTMAGSGPQ